MADYTYIPDQDVAYELVKDAPNDINARWAATGVIRYAVDHLLDNEDFQKKVGMLTVNTLRHYKK